MEKLKVNDLVDYCFLNFGSGKDISIKNLSSLIKEIVGFKGEITFDPTKPDGMKRKLLDSTRIKKLGFEVEDTSQGPKIH